MSNTSRKGGPEDLEQRLDRGSRSGEQVTSERDGEARADDAEQVRGRLGTPGDVSERRRVEQALRENEERFRGIFEEGSVGTAFMSPDGRFVQVNRAYCEFLGYCAAELIGRPFDMTIFPDDLEEVTEHWQEFMSGAPVRPVHERRHVHKSGEVLWALAGLSVLRDSRGAVNGYAVQVQDVTERKRAERALRRSQERFRDIAEAASDWFWEMGEDLRFSYFSDRFREVTGLHPTDLIGRTRWEFAGADLHDEKWSRHAADLRARRPFRNFRYDFLGADGRRHYYSINGKPVFAEDGSFTGYRGTGSDITAEVEAQSRTEEARRRFHDAIENSSEAIALFDADDRLVLCNTRYKEMFDRVVPGLLQPGISLQRIVREGARQGLYGDLGDELEQFVARRLADHGNLPLVRQHRLGDGRWVQVREQRTSEGGMILVQTDITELRHSEEKLRHVHKMEAIGQLTGGIAHDFNNLLGVIMGNAELLAEQVERDDSRIAAIIRASRRGAELTSRLLAFSRRQALEPRAVDLDALIQGMTDLLARTLGERIRITNSPTPALWKARADPGQLENALLNLAINARDAMPAGGTLLIETFNTALRDEAEAARHGVASGDYVSLLVTDNGRGMPPDVLERAVDPFFTTKEVGEGSGLGLSMVYGFARQSGGFATIESQPGEGTRVKLCLPRASEAGETLAALAPAPEPRAQCETVLVVEDDSDVRDLAVTVLAGLGYEVMEAADGRAALELLERAGRIDLVLSDVVLPGGVSGPELVARARDRQPEVKALYMSGYATDALSEEGALDDGVHLLRKPFHRAELAKGVRAALAGHRVPPRPYGAGMG